MLVDLGRNDLGKISKFGSVDDEKYMSIERYSHVMHIGSTVRGEIREDKDALDAIDAILPAGTLSGAPKIRAMEIINELENNKRGIYGGAIGYIDFTGNLDTCIAIRIAFKKNGKVFVRSGAGIVADSVPENEYQECINKAKAVMNALSTGDRKGYLVIDYEYIGRNCSKEENCCRKAKGKVPFRRNKKACDRKGTERIRGVCRVRFSLSEEFDKGRDSIYLRGKKSVSFKRFDCRRFSLS